ncbi:hypothetical protein B0A49_06035 [Cryomyces minteri]|uniref:2EXR domain-containing protein n=1 Tax=Cryomyces minteri TaxID=331657 RepID=A0A4U0XA69_9PEZI|nr:hypothetical protein B0A49_06035 [Cryomyces minteri]
MAVTRSQTAKKLVTRTTTPTESLGRKKRRRSGKRSRRRVNPSVEQQSSGFFKLPVELRNQIYGLVHGPARVIHMRAYRENEQPPLSRVCRQLRNEYLPWYYGNNVFFGIFYVYRPNQGLNHWLKRIGNDKCMMLRRLTVDTHGIALRRVAKSLEQSGVRFAMPLRELTNKRNTCWPRTIPHRRTLVMGRIPIIL